MQIINFNSILSFILFTSIFLACEKDGTMMDEESPVVTLITPSTNDMYMNGDTVHIHAEITDNDELHDISSKVIHTHAGFSQEVWSFDTHSHDGIYTFQEDFIIDVLGMHHDFSLEFTVTDHNGNVGTKEFHFHVMQ